MVIVRRQAKDDTLRGAIDEILVDRVLPLIRNAVLRHSQVPPEEYDEAEDEAMAMFWAAIQGESFFEIRFNLAMKTLAQGAGRRVGGGKQRERERSAERIDSTRADSGAAPLDVADDADDYGAIENDILIRDGLVTLPDEQAQAIVLHYLMDLPVFSQDAGALTVVSTLGCSERKARKLVANGLATIRLWIGEEESDG